MAGDRSSRGSRIVISDVTTATGFPCYDRRFYGHAHLRIYFSRSRPFRGTVSVAWVHAAAGRADGWVGVRVRHYATKSRFRRPGDRFITGSEGPLGSSDHHPRARVLHTRPDRRRNQL